MIKITKLEVAHWGTVYLIIRHGERLENGSFQKKVMGV